MALSKQIQGEISRADIDSTFLMWGRGSGSQPLREDPLLEDKLNGRVVEYQELELDPYVAACLQSRKMAVISRPWDVVPASDDEQDKAVAEFVRSQLKTIAFDDICLKMLDAILVGYSVAEIIWAQKGGQITIDDVRSRNPDRFTFIKPNAPTKGQPRNPSPGKAPPSVKGPTADLWGYQLRLLTDAHPIEGQPLPDKKFVIFSWGSKHANPFGFGLGARVWWPAQWKKDVVKASLVFADRFAEPAMLGKFSPEASTQQVNALEGFLQDLRSQSWAVLPTDTEISFLEAARSGTTDLYDKLLAWCDQQIARAILGQEYGASANQGLGGAPALQDGARLDALVRSDADLLSHAINRSLITWLVGFNFPGATPPQVWRNFDSEEDLGSRAGRDSSLYQMGFRLTLDQVLKIYGEGYEDIQAKSAGDNDPFAQLFGGGGFGGEEPATEAAPPDELPEDEPIEDEPLDEPVMVPGQPPPKPPTSPKPPKPKPVTGDIQEPPAELSEYAHLSQAPIATIARATGRPLNTVLVVWRRGCDEWRSLEHCPHSMRVWARARVLRFCYGDPHRGDRDLA